MAECGKPVGQGVVAYPCIIETDGGPHAGPCMSRESVRSRNERAQWEEARERSQGQPTLEDLGMQGPPKTVIEGLLDPESGKGRRIHPDELRRIKDGFDLTHTEAASLESELVRTAGGVDISHAGKQADLSEDQLSAALQRLRDIEKSLTHSMPEQLSRKIEVTAQEQFDHTNSFGAVKKFKESSGRTFEPKVVGPTDKHLPRKISDLQVHDLVVEDVVARKAKGVDIYGVPLTPFNGRNGAQDAYEEVLDLAAYFRQVLLERDAAAIALYEVSEILGTYFDDEVPSDVMELLQTIANALV